jgi:hypothetical protein
MVMSQAPGGSDAGTQAEAGGRSFGRMVGEASIPRVNVTTAPAPLPLLRAALAYGRAGLYVFPILELTKDEPLVKWGTRATCDAKQIAAWWQQWPHANIGCATGPSGLAVIDTDNKPEGNGENTLRGLPRLTPTRMARTRGGGIHRFYWDDFGEVGNTAGKIGPHVDTRGVGGYVVLPPSRTSKGRYAWLNHAKLARIDPWVIEACAAGKIDPAPQNPMVEWDLPVNVEWARHWLANDAPTSIEGQGGDDTIVKRVVPILKDHAISEETAGELMADVWNDRCQPPWLLGDCDARDNLYTKIHNAYLYCRDRQPGIDTPQADFADAPLPSDEELKQLDVWWKEHDAPRREKRLRRARVSQLA